MNSNDDKKPGSEMARDRKLNKNSPHVPIKGKIRTTVAAEIGYIAEKPVRRKVRTATNGESVSANKDKMPGSEWPEMIER